MNENFFSLFPFFSIQTVLDETKFSTEFVINFRVFSVQLRERIGEMREKSSRACGKRGKFRMEIERTMKMLSKIFTIFCFFPTLSIAIAHF